MRGTGRRRRSWSELEATEKLGYAWVLIYFILIVATALTIIVPAYHKWQEEHKEKKEGSLRPVPADAPARLAAKDARHGAFVTDRGARPPLLVSLAARLG